MQEQDGSNKFDITARLEELRQEQAALAWEGSFRDYFELVMQNPRLAELSHARLNDMIHARGVEKLNEGTRDEVARYNFFSAELFYIEGDLCPQCRYALEHTYGGRHEDVRVHRIIFSEKNRVGIGTFAPSDPKSQDITELTGSIDLSTIGEVGVESDPRAYRFDGELNISNRGLMEFVEMLKVDEKFLYSLLTLSQEQSIKTGRFAMIYADEVIVSHTNENEYIAFAGNKKSEALQDRIILVRVPYNLRVSQEERIYDKLLNQSNILRNIHIAPNTLKVAAMFAVMTRLEEPKRANVDIVKKMKLYDGEDVEGYKSKDVRE